MEKKMIKMKKKSSNIKHRTVYTTNDLDMFINQTYKYRKYFFRNVYMIQEEMPQLNISTRYLELRTLRKVYRCYVSF